MARGHRLEEGRLGAGDIENGLARHRVGQEADEVGRMPGLHRDANLAVGLEAADPGAVAGARVDDHERPLPRVDLDALGRQDADEQVIDRPLEPSAVEHQIGLVVEHVRRDLRPVRLVLDGASAHHVEEEDGPLPGVDPVRGCIDWVWKARVLGSRHFGHLPRRHAGNKIVDGIHSFP